MKTYITGIFTGILATFLIINFNIEIERRENFYEQFKVERQKELKCLADNIYFEARGESTIGKFSVARVVENRLKAGKFGTTFCEVIKQRNKTTCQFSWVCNSKFVKKAETLDIDDKEYVVSLYVAEAVLNGDQYNPVGDSLYYHAKHLGITWKNKIKEIGNHIFYKGKLENN